MDLQLRKQVAEMLEGMHELHELLADIQACPTINKEITEVMFQRAFSAPDTQIAQQHFEHAQSSISNDVTTS